MRDPKLEFGQLLRAKRREQHKSAMEMAAALDIHLMTYLRFERGDHPAPLSKLIQAASEVGISLSDFFRNLESSAETNALCPPDPRRAPTT